MSIIRILLLFAGMGIVFSGCAPTAGHSEAGEVDSEVDTGGYMGPDGWVPIVIPDVTLDQAEVEKSWVVVPAGTFLYGTPDTQLCKFPLDEQVEVILTHSFKMASTEITRAEWMMTGFPDPSNAEKCDDCAVAYVNWFDTLAWMNTLSRSVGLDECYDLESCVGDPASGCPDGEYYREKCLVIEGTLDPLPQNFRCEGDLHRYPDHVSCPGYRLPTVAEWEWAARGGTTTATYNGELTVDTLGIPECVPDPVVDPIAWHDCNSGLVVHPVGELLPNAYGLYDMLGNVEEWVDDIFTGGSLEHNEGKAPPLVDPVGFLDYDVTDLMGARGGSMLTDSCVCTASSSMYSSNDLRMSISGFRPVRTIFEE